MGGHGAAAFTILPPIIPGSGGPQQTEQSGNVFLNSRETCDQLADRLERATPTKGEVMTVAADDDDDGDETQVAQVS